MPGFWPLAGSVVEPWPPSALWEGVEERLSPALEVECVTESWGFTSLELQSAGRQEDHGFKTRTGRWAMWFYRGAAICQVDQRRGFCGCSNEHANTLTEESFVIFVTFSPRAPVGSTVRLPPLCHAHPLHPAAVCEHKHTHNHQWAPVYLCDYKEYLLMVSGCFLC